MTIKKFDAATVLGVATDAKRVAEMLRTWPTRGGYVAINQKLCADLVALLDGTAGLFDEIAMSLERVEEAQGQPPQSSASQTPPPGEMTTERAFALLKRFFGDRAFVRAQCGAVQALLVTIGDIATARMIENGKLDPFTRMLMASFENGDPSPTGDQIKALVAQVENPQ